MAVIINTNMAATMASNNLAASNSLLTRSLNRLSSGSKIVNPSDDAGGLAVSMKLSAAARRSGAAAINIANSQSYLQTQDGALKTMGKLLDRVGELKTLSTDPTKNTSDKANYDTEYEQIRLELLSVGQEKFNGVNLFDYDGTVPDVTGSSGYGNDWFTGAAIADLTVQVSEDGQQTVTVPRATLADFVSGQGTSLSVVAGSVGLTAVSHAVISDAIQHVATLRAVNGATQSRLGFAAELLTVNKANLEQANSRISDVDVAEESTQLARYNVLVQSGTAMLSQANQSSQSVMRLIG